jgi:hypothetical protein
MMPRKSLLKFRLPWNKGQSRYLDGRPFLPVWGAQTTAESCLIPDDNVVATDANGGNVGGNSANGAAAAAAAAAAAVAPERVWQDAQYEDQMFYFNTVTRQVGSITLAFATKPSLFIYSFPFYSFLSHLT